MRSLLVSQLGNEDGDRYQVFSPFPCQRLRKEKQKRALHVFMAEVHTKLRFISLESDEEQLPRLFQMKEIITLHLQWLIL